MNAFLKFLFGTGADQIIGPRHEVVRPSPNVIGPTSQVIGPTAPESIVEAPARYAWDEKRWTRTTRNGGTELTGRYRVFDRRGRRWREFEGLVRQQGREIAAYVADPPPEIRRHRHGACFQLVKLPWFRLHWTRQPKNLDAALMYMEQLLDESINA